MTKLDPWYISLKCSILTFRRAGQLAHVATYPWIVTYHLTEQNLSGFSADIVVKS